MTYTRRSITFGLGALALAGCANGVGNTNDQKIDARADQALNFMYNRYPGTANLANNAAGMLVMPLVTEAGLGFGGSFGRGALRVNDITVDYYSSTSASAGLQIGAQQFAHVLFFMTDDALLDFRRSPGWALGADAEYAIQNEGDTIRAETTTSLAPVIAVVFAQTGFRAGATLEGTKYTRIIP